MAAISNSSPLIIYSRARRLGLLRSVFDHLYIPPAVWTEVVAHGSGRPGADELTQASWISTIPPTNTENIKSLEHALDRGEAEAISLALEFPQRLPILIDDLTGRRVASALGIEVVGSAGVLLRAKDYGFITQVRPLLDELRSSGLYLGRSAITEILQLAHEE